MRFTGRLAMAAALLTLVAAPVSAQRWTWDFGINGGYSWMTHMLDEDETGLDSDVAGSSVRFDHGWLVGSQLGYWFGSRLGARANFRYADRALVGNDDIEFLSSVNLWGGTIDLMYRFTEPRSEYSGLEVLPYIAGGLGAKWTNPAGDGFLCADAGDNETSLCGPFFTGAPLRGFALDEGAVIAGLVGLGADWRVARNWSIRTEISDQIYEPKVRAITGPAGGNEFAFSSDGIGATVHELGAQIGLHMLFGVPRPAPVAVAPAPLPPPPPPPTPPPPPAEEAITVCVIDPTTTGGIRMESAVFVPSTRDTLVTVNGQRVPLRTAVGNVVVASNANWFISGQPMVITVGSQRIEMVTTGTARMVEATDLAFLGTVNGLPVYADRDDVQDVREEIDELNRAQRGADLGKILEEHRDIREDLADVKVFYVPLQPTGCVFQAMQVQEQVRKKQQ